MITYIIYNVHLGCNLLFLYIYRLRNRLRFCISRYFAICHSLTTENVVIESYQPDGGSSMGSIIVILTPTCINL